MCNQALFECLALNLHCLRGDQTALTAVINHRIVRIQFTVFARILLSGVMWKADRSYLFIYSYTHILRTLVCKKGLDKSDDFLECCKEKKVGTGFFTFILYSI